MSLLNKSMLLWTVSVLVVLGTVSAVSSPNKIDVDHSYYQMTLYQRNHDNMFDTHFVNVSKENGGRTHEFLSSHSQAAEAVAPGFEFPFYGHVVDRFYVTTHGFLSFAPRLHNLMYKTQYIAPLRVKLDPSASNASTIDYVATESRLTIQWTNVTVAEPYQHPMGGRFTFQVTLYENGDIVFVYIKIPVLLTSDALYDREPVAGLSDAFLIGDSELHVYHTLNVEPRHINSKTVVVFRAKPTCIQQQSCRDCMNLRETSDFQCAWCSKIRRCSDGADRLREHWNLNGCSEENANVSTTMDQCPSHIEWRSSVIRDGYGGGSGQQNEGLNAGSIVSMVVSAFLILILLVIMLGYVYVYGRHNPGGLAERIALRLEANYRRFIDDEETATATKTRGNKAQGVELEPKMTQNNNNITVSF